MQFIIHAQTITVILSCLSVVCPSRTGCRSMSGKGTPNGSGLSPAPHPIYAAAKKLKWPSFKIFVVRFAKKTTRRLDAPAF